jgi:hypothetical protein
MCHLNLMRESAPCHLFLLSVAASRSTVGIASALPSAAVLRASMRLGGLLVVVVCVEKCGVPLMCSTCRGCGAGAR